MVYETSHINRRRATKAEMEARAEALIDIVSEIEPCTVRQVFYQATVRGIVEKTEAGIRKHVVFPVRFVPMTGEATR